MKKLTINLTIERGKDCKFWGNLTYNENLITVFAENIPELEGKLKIILKDFEEIELDQVVFVHQ